MAKYTFELRELFSPIKFNPPLYTRAEVEAFFTQYELSDYLTSDEIDVIESRGVWSKSKLATKIVDHYYMRESGFETPALFKHYAKIEMQELMEEYLPLIYSASIEYDPLVNVDYTETYERDLDSQNNTNSNSQNTSSSSATSSGSNTSNSTSASSGLNILSDTPQGQISKSAILNGTYATSTNGSENSITDSTTNTTSSTNTGSNTLNSAEINSTTGNINEEYTKRVKGNSGVSTTAQKMIQQYRENIRAIDREIIKRLNYLFMGLY